MTRFPTIGEVVSHLRETGRDAMALAVERLEASLDDCRRANETNFRAVNELRAKYEPPTYRFASNKPPPEASG